jgi:hypothetical protein
MRKTTSFSNAATKVSPGSSSLHARYAFFPLFFVLTALLLSIYTGPATAATQDVAPAALRSSAIALTLLLAHLFGDAFAPSLVGVLATALDLTHLHFNAALAGQDLRTAMLWTCTPALLLAGLTGMLGTRWMGHDVAATEQAESACQAH